MRRKSAGSWWTRSGGGCWNSAGIALSVTDGALRQLVREGYDSRYGARPLKRTVQRRIEDRLSEEILLGNVSNGQKVTVDYADGEYLFSAQ